jgi:MinD superfamily P-loop ATPase
MKQIVVLSGKGGTGKTTITAAFAHLSSQHTKTSAVLVDADVDAANLGLVLNPQHIDAHDFAGGQTAVIDPTLCDNCGICEEVCRFDAVISTNATYTINPLDCEGCAACKTQCPNAAIYMEARSDGEWFFSQTRFGLLFHARLKPAQENSGKLVTLLRQQAVELAEKDETPLILVDGPPGIGCSVIASLSGADLVIIVTEPTAASIHDMKRVLSLVQHFNIPALICTNKADLFESGKDAIIHYCQDNGLPIVGEIPFDTIMTDAMIQGQPITVYAPQSSVSKELQKTWQQILDRIP